MPPGRGGVQTVRGSLGGASRRWSPPQTPEQPIRSSAGAPTLTAAQDQGGTRRGQRGAARGGSTLTTALLVGAVLAVHLAVTSPGLRDAAVDTAATAEVPRLAGDRHCGRNPTEPSLRGKPALTPQPQLCRAKTQFSERRCQAHISG